MSTDRQIADAARWFVCAEIARVDAEPADMMHAITVRDLAWTVLLHEVNADTIVDTEPL